MSGCVCTYVLDCVAASVMLTAVPEPTATSWMSVGCVSLFSSQRSRSSNNWTKLLHGVAGGRRAPQSSGPPPLPPVVDDDVVTPLDAVAVVEAVVVGLLP